MVWCECGNNFRRYRQMRMANKSGDIMPVTTHQIGYAKYYMWSYQLNQRHEIVLCTHVARIYIPELQAIFMPRTLHTSTAPCASSPDMTLPDMKICFSFFLFFVFGKMSRLWHDRNSHFICRNVKSISFHIRTNKKKRKYRIMRATR